MRLFVYFWLKPWKEVAWFSYGDKSIKWFLDSHSLPSLGALLVLLSLMLYCEHNHAEKNYHETLESTLIHYTVHVLTIKKKRKNEHWNIVQYLQLPCAVFAIGTIKKRTDTNRVSKYRTEQARILTKHTVKPLTLYSLNRRSQ